MTVFGGTAACAMISGVLFASPAHAQIVDLNYDRLSSLEEPIAYEFANITVEVSGVADVPVLAEYNGVTGGVAGDGTGEGQPSIDVEFVGNFQIAAETQLANRWEVGVTYFGQYSTDPDRLFLGGPMGGGDYNDNVAGFVRTSFGTFIGGNTANQVRELTRRQRGVGNGFLAFDDFYGQLSRWGGAYVGRFGASQIGLAVDENGDFEAGTVFQRPIRQRDLRFSGRVRRAAFTSADGTDNFDTLGAGVVGEMVYGSTIYDLGAGYENVDGTLTSFDRWFVSGGAQTQLGGLRLSGELHYGQADGQSEYAASLGAGYDVSRGISLNLGVNAQDARIVSDGVQIVETEQVSAVASARYSF